MTSSKTVLNLKVRTNTPREGVQAFQAEVVPHAAYEGRELYERLSECLGLPRDGYRARTMVESLESFIRQELEQGNRLDFGLVSFFPKLSAALPTRDADPSEADLYVRGAVKARKSLAASLERYLVAKNPNAGEPLWVCNILNETLNEYDIIGKNHTLSICGAGATLDTSMPDEGVWLEKPIKRRHQKHIPVAHAEILEVKDGQIRCRFTEVPSPRKYNLVIATRGGAGKTYTLRYVRHLVTVRQKNSPLTERHAV